MTTIVNLTRAELRKLVASRTFLIGLALSVGLSVISVAVIAAVAGKNGTPALGTTASTDKMLELGVLCAVGMLVLGILGSGSEYKHKTIIPAMLAAPRRGTLVTAKVIGIAVAGALLSTLTFGSGLAVAVAELSAHHLHHLPADTGTLFWGSVVTGILFGVVGVALGYITRSAIAAIVGAVGWVPSAELAILRTVARTWPSGWSPAPPLPSPTPGCSPIMPSPRPLPSRVLSGYTVALLITATWLVRRRDIT